jgi:hypothetical protein
VCEEVIEDADKYNCNAGDGEYGDDCIPAFVDLGRCLIHMEDAFCTERGGYDVDYEDEYFYYD